MSNENFNLIKLNRRLEFNSKKHKFRKTFITFMVLSMGSSAVLAQKDTTQVIEHPGNGEVIELNDELNLTEGERGEDAKEDDNKEIIQPTPGGPGQNAYEIKTKGDPKKHPVVFVKNINGGDGGEGGWFDVSVAESGDYFSADGGKGGAVIDGENIEITVRNNVEITGGLGGKSGKFNENIDDYDGEDTGSTVRGGNDGEGGSAIIGENLIINNEKEARITGGRGTNNSKESIDIEGVKKLIGGVGSKGGDAITIDNSEINNSGEITGGDGLQGVESSSEDTYQYIGGKGGDGGLAIKGDNLTINNEDDGKIKGGEGNQGGTAAIDVSNKIGEDRDRTGDGGKGGNGIEGSNLIIINTGEITAGQGGDGGQVGRYYEDENFILGNGGDGGDAIVGSDLQITNNGTIERGKFGKPYQLEEDSVEFGDNIDKGKNGKLGTAIKLTSGMNELTLNAGSKIVGDIYLQDIEENKKNQLIIKNTKKSEIDGGLTAGKNTKIFFLNDYLLNFKEDSDFYNNSTLIFDSKENNSPFISIAGKAKFHNLKDNEKENITLVYEISEWKKSDISLISAEKGIKVNNELLIKNELLTYGAKDFSYSNFKGNSTPFDDEDDNSSGSLYYSLKWHAKNKLGYGTFDIKKGKTLNLNLNLTNNINENINNWDGKTLTKDGFGTLVLSSSNDYTGDTIIKNGMLELATVNAIKNSPNVKVNENGKLNFLGNNQKIKVLKNEGTVYVNQQYSSQSKDEKEVLVEGNVENSGDFVIKNNYFNKGQVYSQKGDWHGNHGTVFMNAILVGDESLTDLLKIKGKADGTTYISINNVGGKGEQTLEGIKIIETQHSTPESFVQKHRIVAGSYEYFLQQGTALGENITNWYLTSRLSNQPDTPIWRPEAGSYTSNLYSANTLFLNGLYDRLGETKYSNMSNKTKSTTSLWMRHIGTHQRNKMSDHQNKTQANSYVVMLGGDLIQNNSNDVDGYHAGLMFGYARNSNTTTSSVTHSSSHGKVDGYAAGLYGTWYQDYKDKSGLYLDSWILYNWFDNKVDSQDLTTESYRSRGITAALESGYNKKVGEYVPFGQGDMINSIWVQPKFKVTWMGVKAKSHTESNGTRIHGEGHNNIQTDIGLRAYIQGRSFIDLNKDREFQPFVELSWIHNTKNFGVIMNNEKDTMQGTRNIGVIKLGVEGKINNNLSLWGNISPQIGGKGFSHTQAMFAFKYSF